MVGIRESDSPILEAPRLWTLGQKVFRLIEDHPEAFTGWRILAEVGLLFSRSTMERHGRPASDPRDEALYNGMFAGLQHGGVTFRTILERDLEPSVLANLRAVVLPGVACLSDQQCEVLREFVRAGGALLATGATSLYNETGGRRDDFALADVLGVRSTNVTHRAHTGYAECADGGPFNVAATGTLLPLAGELLEVEPTGSAVLARFVEPPSTTPLRRSPRRSCLCSRHTSSAPVARHTAPPHWN